MSLPLTESQAATLRLWRTNSRGTTAAEYLLHESEVMDRLSTSGRGVRNVTASLVARGLAVVHSWDDGNLLQLTPAGLAALDEMAPADRAKDGDDV